MRGYWAAPTTVIYTTARVRALVAASFSIKLKGHVWLCVECLRAHTHSVRARDREHVSSERTSCGGRTKREIMLAVVVVIDAAQIMRLCCAHT